MRILDFYIIIWGYYICLYIIQKYFENIGENERL
jgi:hypothetical protein